MIIATSHPEEMAAAKRWVEAKDAHLASLVKVREAGTGMVSATTSDERFYAALAALRAALEEEEAARQVLLDAAPGAER